MNFFIASFLVGVLFVVLPQTRTFLFLIQTVFYSRPLELWQMALVWGLIFSVVFFVSKDLIEKNGHLKFWIFATILAVFLIVLIMFLASSPGSLY